MMIEALKQDLMTNFRITAGYWTQSIYEHLAPMIPEGTELLCAMEGLDADRSQNIAIIVTEETVYLATYQSSPTTPDISVMKYSDVIDVEVEGEFLAQVTMDTLMGRYVIKGMALTCAKALKQKLGHPLTRMIS